MKGKWATGIVPRNFAWVIKDGLAVSERPGGYARTHRRVRRQEEIIWIREQGFARVVSLLTSPHNLHAYDELGVKWEHLPLDPHGDTAALLTELYPRLRDWLAAGERVLVHQEELGDHVQGVVAGYLVWGQQAQRLQRDLAAARVAAATTGEREYHVTGVVRAGLGDLGLLVVTHGEIPGYMPAMTMGFRTASPKIVESVKVGDAVRFTLRGTPPNLAITAIEKTAP